MGGMMAITVRFPSMLHANGGDRRSSSTSRSATSPRLLAALERRIPGISRSMLADPIFNVAVNDEMLLHGVRQHPLKDGDVVEIVPTISGG